MTLRPYRIDVIGKFHDAVAVGRCRIIRPAGGCKAVIGLSAEVTSWVRSCLAYGKRRGAA